MHRQPRRLRANRAGLLPPLLTVCIVAACKGPGLDPAPFKAPAVGTAYHYSRGLVNKITSVDGWRIGFVDGQGSPGSRLGLFISEDPKSPLAIDPGQLEQLWPLDLNKSVTITVMHGPELYRWTFRVPSEENVNVDGTNYPSYVVQAVQEPVLVRDPRRTTSTINTWWYSPELNAVVRFRTTYVGGPTAGRVFESALERIDLPLTAIKRDSTHRADGTASK